MSSNQGVDYFLEAKKRLSAYSAIAFNYEMMQVLIEDDIGQVGKATGEAAGQEADWEESLSDMLSPASRKDAQEGDVIVSKDVVSSEDMQKRASLLQSILFFRHFDAVRPLDDGTCSGTEPARWTRDS